MNALSQTHNHHRGIPTDLNIYTHAAIYPDAIELAAAALVGEHRYLLSTVRKCSAPLAEMRGARPNREAMRAGDAGGGCRTLRRVIEMQPVLEMYTPDGFDLWPVAEVESFGFPSGELSPAEVGSAVMRIASCNDLDPDCDRPPRPADALDSFLHGLLTFDNLFAAGGLRVTDNSTGVTFLPGCCDGLEDWRDWHQFIDDGSLLCFGHDPVSPVAERFGDTVRLTDGQPCP